MNTNEINTYTIEPDTNDYVQDGAFILFLGSIAVSFALYYFTSSQKILPIIGFGLISICIRVFAYILAGKGAKNRGREPRMWSYYAFISPPLTLFILALKGNLYPYHAQDFVDDLTTKYNLEKTEILNEYGFDRKKERLEKLHGLRSRYNQLLNEGLQHLSKRESEIKTALYKESLEKQKNIGGIPLVSEDFEELPKTTHTNILQNCPACNTNIAENTEECPECGLWLGG